MVANVNIDPSSKISDRDLIYEAKLKGKIPELMRGVIRRKTIERQVKQAGISPTVEDLQAAADRFRLFHQLETTEATKKWLDERFLSLDDFEDIITQDLLSERLAQHLFGDRVEKLFYQNLLDYCTATIYEVILEDYELAMEIYYSLQEGDLSFTDVAQQYITAPELRRRGGYVGKVVRKQLRPELAAAIFAIKQPQLLEPIVTAVGIHLIQVEEIVEPKLDAPLHQQILNELFDRWLVETIAADPEYSQIQI